VLSTLLDKELRLRVSSRSEVVERDRELNTNNRKYKRVKIVEILVVVGSRPVFVLLWLLAKRWLG